MGWFKCKHPFNRLVVERAETEKKIDEDFQQVDYHFKCGKCGKELSIGYTRCTGGVEAFLARQHFQKLRSRNDHRKRT